MTLVNKKVAAKAQIGELWEQGRAAAHG